MVYSIVTDWKVEEVYGKVFGMMYVTFAPPYQRMDFSRGFSLHSPTHKRCATQALLLALDAIDGSSFISPEDKVALATKNKWLYDIITDENKLRHWIDTGRWPRASQECRSLLCTLYKRLRPNIEIVYIERDFEDKPYVDLNEGRDPKKFDVNKMINEQKKPPEMVEKFVTDLKMKEVMYRNLMDSGARCYRRKKTIS